MDIVRARQEKRAEQILQLEIVLKKAKDKGKEIDERKLLLTTMSELNISKRTAQEYIEVAKFNVEKE